MESNTLPAGFEALSKRFKDYVRQLQSEIRSLREALPVSEPTAVRIVDRLARGDGRTEAFLPDRTEIAFRMPPARAGWTPRWVNVRFDSDKQALQIHGDSFLAVLPSSANMLYITEVER